MNGVVEELDVWLELIKPFDFGGRLATACAPLRST